MTSAPDADGLDKGDARVDELRKRMRDVDRQILALAAERAGLAKSIGAEKEARGLPIQDFQVERLVIDRARAACEELGLDRALGEAIMRPLIEAAVKLQEKDRTRGRRLTGHGSRVLIIGGSGRMGRWFADFLDDQGHRVTISDPKGPLEGFAYVEDPIAAAEDHDVVILAAPPSQTARLLDALRDGSTTSVVFDISSLKSPLQSHLESAAAAGLDVCSIHPMFGPNADLLSGRHVIICPLGSERATRTARAFFEPTCATLVEMGLEDHDRLVAYVLGLSHAINIVFNDVLATNVPFRDVQSIGSTTFERQVAVARQVANENPHLYYEIQALNRYTPRVLDALKASLTALDHHVREQDRDAFLDMMGRARDYYAGAAPDPTRDDAQAAPGRPAETSG